MNVAEVAEYLGLHPVPVYRLAGIGRIPFLSPVGILTVPFGHLSLYGNQSR